MPQIEPYLSTTAYKGVLDSEAEESKEVDQSLTSYPERPIFSRTPFLHSTTFLGTIL